MAKDQSKNETPPAPVSTATPAQTALPVESQPTLSQSIAASDGLAAREAELRERERQLEERAKMLEQRERSQDSRDTETLSGARFVSAPADAPRTTGSVKVLNNAAHAIGLYDGTPLLPGVTTVSRFAWSKMFLPDGKTPTPGNYELFYPTGGGKPALQVVSVDNVSALAEEHAHTAISESEDIQRLSQFEQTETRPVVKEAISKRIADLKKAKAAKK